MVLVLVSLGYDRVSGWEWVMHIDHTQIGYLVPKFYYVLTSEETFSPAMLPFKNVHDKSMFAYPAGVLFWVLRLRFRWSNA